MKKLLAALLALALVTVPFVSVGAKTETGNRHYAIGMNISDMNTTDIDMNPVDGAIFAQTTMTIINFWATWCGPCRAEMPHFQTIHEYYSSTNELDVQLYGCLLEDSTSTIAAAKALCAQLGCTWTHLRRDNVLTSVLLATEEEEGGVYIPQTIIVNRQGEIVDHVVGSFQNYNDLADWVSGWLETLSETDPPVCPEPDPAIPGDCDGDGQITVQDALAILRVYMGLSEAPGGADLDANGDGSFDMQDALYVLRFAMGLIS